MSENGGTDKFAIFVAFVAGGFIGAGLALLLAPSSGRETREKIKGASTEARDKTIERATEAKQRVTELVEKGKEKAVETKADVQAAVEAGKEAFQKRKTELLEEVKET